MHNCYDENRKILRSSGAVAIEDCEMSGSFGARVRRWDAFNRMSKD